MFVEGPNQSGKSTLVETLSKHFKKSVSHSGCQPEDLDGACQAQLSLLKIGVIVDRVTPISELVYHPENAELFDHEYWLDQMFECGPVIYCTAKGEPIDKEYYPPNHYDKLVKEIADIRNRYERIMSQMHHIRYDYHVDNIDELLEKVHEAIQLY